MKRIKRLVKTIVANLLAWGSFGLAIIGGLTATSTFLGTIIVKIVHIGPWWLPFPLIGVGAVLWIGDLARDGIPNAWAIYISMVWPSFFMAIGEGKNKGKAHDYMAGWIDDLSHWMDRNLTVWVGHTGSKAVMTLAAMTSISMALVWMYRYASINRTNARSGGGAGVDAGIPAGVGPSRRPGR